MRGGHRLDLTHASLRALGRLALIVLVHDLGQPILRKRGKIRRTPRIVAGRRARRGRGECGGETGEFALVLGVVVVLDLALDIEPARIRRQIPLGSAAGKRPE